MYRAEGMPGFFRGLVAAQTKILPAAALMFAINERFKKLLKL